MKSKPATTVSRLPGDWEEQQYQPSRETSPIWLPEPQERFVHPPGPGKREDGKLWFDGPTRRNIAGDKVNLAQMSRERLTMDGTELKMRDFRRGDRWLPWHFKSDERKGS